MRAGVLIFSTWMDDLGTYLRRGLLGSERVRRHPVKQHQACVHNESGYVKFSRWNFLAVVTPWWQRSNDVSDLKIVISR